MSCSSTTARKRTQPRCSCAAWSRPNSARLWAGAGAAGAAARASPSTYSPAEDLFTTVSALTPNSEAQRSAQTRALQLMTTMGTTIRLLYLQAGGSLSWPFFVVLVFWLVVLFVGFGLYARRNATVVAALFVGALTVAGAIFLILEMNRPYGGLMQLSSAPIRDALEPDRPVMLPPVCPRSTRSQAPAPLRRCMDRDDAGSRGLHDGGSGIRAAEAAGVEHWQQADSAVVTQKPAGQIRWWDVFGDPVLGTLSRSRIGTITA